jgi:two-component system CheB/CheR fusion protein
MYFNAETQGHILERFNFALNDGGYLFLGKAETLLRQSTIFTPVELRLRLFAKSADSTRVRPPNGAVARNRVPDELVGLPVLADVAFDTIGLPVVVLDGDNTVVLVTAAARALFGIQLRDVGSPLQNLEISYRPVELRSLLNEALTERRPVERKGVHWSEKDESRVFDVLASPQFREDGSVLGATVTFQDVTRYHRLQDELEQSNRDLEAAYEELQSTNEELETTNEELQSTNEELHTLNEQLGHRSGELDQVNMHLEGILTGLRLGVAVLGRDLAVQVWNRWAEDQWGLRREEVTGRSFLSLDIGLPVSELALLIHRCRDGVADHEEVTLPARNRRGQAIDCRIILTQLALGETIQGVILVMEERPPSSEDGENR